MSIHLFLAMEPVALAHFIEIVYTTQSSFYIDNINSLFFLHLVSVT